MNNPYDPPQTCDYRPVRLRDLLAFGWAVLKTAGELTILLVVTLLMLKIVELVT